MRQSARRSLLLAGIGLAIVLVVLPAVLHLGIVRNVVRSRLVQWVSESYDVALDVGELDYDLSSLTVWLRDVRVATADDPDRAFFTASVIRVDFAASTLLGTLAVDELAVDAPRLTIDVDAFGASTIPTPPEPDTVDAGARSPDVTENPTSPLRLVSRIRALNVRDLEARITNAAADVSVDLRGLGIEATTVGQQFTGRLTLLGGGDVRAGGRATAVTRLDGGFEIERDDIRLTDLQIATNDARLNIDLAVSGADTIESARLGGRYELTAAAPWLGTLVGMDPARAVGGTISARGTLEGTIDEPVVDVDVRGEGLQWERLDDLDITASARIERSGLDLRALSLAVDGGSVTGTGRIPFTDDGRIAATLAWVDLGSATLDRALPGRGLAAVSTIASGRLDLDSRDASFSDVRATLEILNRDGAGSGTPLSGFVRIEARDGRLDTTFAQDAREAFGVRGRLASALDHEAWMRSSIAGRLDVTSGSLDALTAEPLITGWLPSATPGVSGVARLSLDVGGTLDGPTVTGPLEVLDLAVEGRRLGTLSTTIRRAHERVDLDALRVSNGVNVLTATASLRPSTATIEGTFRFDGSDLATLGATSPDAPAPAWWPAGAGSIDGTIAGRLDEPTITARVDAGPIDIAGQRIASLTGTVRLDDGIVTAEAIEAVIGSARVSVDGRYTLASGRYTVSARSDGAPLTALHLPVTASGLRLDALATFELAGEGTLDDPGLSGTLRLDNAVVDGRPVGVVTTDVALGNGELRVDGTIPDLSTTARGRLSVVDSSDFDASLVFDNLDLSRLDLRSTTESGGGERASGTLTATVGLRGSLDRPDRFEADIELSALDALIGSTPLVLERRGRITYAPTAITSDRLVLRSGAMQATLDGRLADDSDGLRLSMAGPLDAANDVLQMLQPATWWPISNLGGEFALDAHATGTPDDPRIAATFRLDDGRAVVGDLPAVADVRLRARYDTAAFGIADVEASWQGARLTGRLNVPHGLLTGWGTDAASAPSTGEPATLSLAVESISPDTVAPFIGDDLAERLDGRVDATLEMTATGWTPLETSGELRLTDAGLIVGGVRIGQQRPSIVRFAEGRLDIADWSWVAAGNEVVVAGGLDLTRDDGLDMTVRGEMDLRLAGVFMADAATAGHASVNVRLTGSLLDPRAAGLAVISGAELRLATPRVVVTEVDGALALTSDRIEIVELSGLANGGSLRLTGELSYEGFATVQGAVAAHAEGLALDFPTGLRSHVNADVRLDLAPGGSTVSGRVTVQRGSYREPLSVTTQLLATLDQRSLATRATADPSAIDDVRLDIGISTSEDIFVDNNYGRFSLGGDLQLIGTIGRPALAGRTALREGGVVLLGGNVYQLEAGSIDFTDPTRIEPELDLRVRTRISEYDVRLRLSGTPDSLETELTADPVLGQSDIVSLLLTGRTLADAGNAGAEVARDQVLSYLSGEFVGAAGRAIGLDVLRLDRGATTAEDVRFDSGLVATETNPGARLTFGKRLNQDLELIFSQSLQRSGDFTWIVDYSPWRQTDVRLVSRDNEDRSYQFWHDLSFGGGVPASARRPQESTERVDRILIQGAPGFGDVELREQLRLSSGDRFDFYRWQADRDRLLRFYHDRGFLEANVRTRRDAASAPDAVTIQYDVDRGPRCELIVTGATLPGSLTAAMRDRWTRSTFDEFLVQDLIRMVRLHLASDGYMRAAIDPVVSSSEDRATKVIEVRIDRGQPSERFEIAFIGVADIDAQRLDALLSPTERRAAFIDASSVAATIAGRLRDDGFLDAEVSADAPTFQGATATLPLTISTGHAFVVGDVILTGVLSRPADDVRGALDLPTGSVFSQDRLDAGRRAVTASYRRIGFNAVDVRLATQPDPDRATVRVEVVVDEGPRQVLQQTIVEGAEQTRPGLIASRLGFAIGDPIDLQAWYRARKRLYDTGAFRRVDLEFEPVSPTETTGVASTEPVRARVLVEEWPRYRLRYGFQLDDERAPVGETGRSLSAGVVGDLVRRNLFGRAITVGVATRIERRDQTARTFLSMPALFGLPVTSNVFLSRSRTEFGDATASPFVTTKHDVTLEQRFALGASTRVTYGYNFQRSHTVERDPDPRDPFPFDIRISTARLTAAITVDTRDDLLDATRGWFHASSVEYASEALGSDLRFGKYLMQQYYFHSLPGNVVLATAVRAGVIDAFGQDTIPSERFFAGGGNTVRGYAEDSLGEIDFFGGARGGDALFLVNQEVRVPLTAWLQGVGFVDAGRPFASITDFSLSTLDASVGFGVRLRTPFVMIRVDYGQPLSRVDGVRPGGRWFFSIGQMF